MNYKIPLATTTISDEEINDVTSCLKSKSVTMGKKVAKFEEQFASRVGAQNAIMVNSGSSANLLALFTLFNPFLEKNLKRDDEVIVPAVSWSTTVFPIVQAGGVPVFADCGPDYQIDPSKIESLITDKTKAIMPTHILGNVCAMDEINSIAKKHDLYVVEDTCESLGASYKKRQAGTFGDIGTYSFYFSHHITTIEGGMLVSDDAELTDIVRVMRNHGQVRDSAKKNEFIKRYPNIDPRFMFINLGFNLRPTELNAVMGIDQLKKLDGIIATRNSNVKELVKELQQYEEYLALPSHNQNVVPSWFAFPITVKKNKIFDRNRLTEHLEKSSIETRSLIAGNLLDHPVFRDKKIKYRAGDLTNAENVMYNSFYFGIYQDVDVQYIANAFHEFFKRLNI